MNRTISPGQKAAGLGPGSGRRGPRSGPPQRAYLSTVPLALARSRCWKRPWAWGSRKASRQPGALTEMSQSGLSDAACDALQAEMAGTWLLLLPRGAPGQGETRAAVTLMAPALDRAPVGGRADAWERGAAGWAHRSCRSKAAVRLGRSSSRWSISTAVPASTSTGRSATNSEVRAGLLQARNCSGEGRLSPPDPTVGTCPSLSSLGSCLLPPSPGANNQVLSTCHRFFLTKGLSL